MGLDTVLALHQKEAFGMQVTGSIRASGFRDVVSRIENGEVAVNECRFFCGYAGWAPGQLQAEIDAGVWYTCSACEEVIMKQRSGSAVSDVLKMMGGRFLSIARRMEERGNSSSS